VLEIQCEKGLAEDANEHPSNYNVRIRGSNRGNMEYTESAWSVLAIMARWISVLSLSLSLPLSPLPLPPGNKESLGQTTSLRMVTLGPTEWLLI
jgi:hypothetical protein